MNEGRDGHERSYLVCLLKEVDSGCKMALDSMAQIKGYVSDQKLKNTIDGYEKKHQAMGGRGI